MNNVIAFDRTRRAALCAVTGRETTAGTRNNVVSISEWKSRPRARRTASGVFFSTGVLLTYGNVA
ncbi:hypothetical protein [Sinisalibacter aestuarii]|uniref:ESPR domain-containing protein n=1 Tax=Sinisalibacter aestuarii TaxID=2949426 RepID=A0ABQ5LMU2_9RHOB|nr:hypothetical protein [Sinisalibacter aestuarii]GKY86280.1 hypothetical protein STA1M1_01490 [Sinisalibacter aestuarii]